MGKTQLISLQSRPVQPTQLPFMTRTCSVERQSERKPRYHPALAVLAAVLRPVVRTGFTTHGKAIRVAISRPAKRAKDRPTRAQLQGFSQIHHPVPRPVRHTALQLALTSIPPICGGALVYRQCSNILCQHHSTCTFASRPSTHLMTKHPATPQTLSTKDSYGGQMSVGPKI